MIDINTLIQEALEKAINEAVQLHLQTLTREMSSLQESVNGAYTQLIEHRDKIDRLNNMSNAFEADIERIDDKLRRIGASQNAEDERFANDVASAIEENDDVIQAVRSIVRQELDEGDENMENVIKDKVVHLFQSGDLVISIDKV